MIEIMDTTLRDGEQVAHGGYPAEWKLKVTQALLSAGVDRVEVTSALVSPGEQKMLGQVMEWASKSGLEHCIEVLGLVDGHKSVDWIRVADGRVINLLCKGSEDHCREQLKMDVHRHLAAIEKTVDYAVKNGMTVNAYLEDWSYGIAHSPGYLKTLLDGLAELPIKRVMLCDTRGLLNYWQTEKSVAQMISWQPELVYDYHGHNDYGLAVPNSLSAIKAGVSGVHCTVNGLGERSGNTFLDEAVVNIHDQLPCKTRVKEICLRPLGELVALMSGRRIPFNKPIIGSNSYVHTAGIHADGNIKGGLYEHPRLKPSRFGDRSKHSMGKLSGKSNVVANLRSFGLELDEMSIKLVLDRIVKLGDDGQPVTAGNLPYIVASVLNRPEYVVFKASIETHSATGARSMTWGTVEYRNRTYEIFGRGKGGFDAFMVAVKKWAKKKGVIIPKLIDFDAGIPPGGSTSAFVQPVIDWEWPDGRGRFQTMAFHFDQTIAAIEAAVAAINFCNCNGSGKK